MGSGAGAPSDPFVTTLIGTVVALVLLGDVALLAVWGDGILRSEPLLARRWSAADVFLGLQAVLGAVFAASFFLFAALAIFRVPISEEKLSSPTGPVFYGFMLPALAVQEAALVAVPLLVTWLKYREPVSALGLQPLRGGRWRQLLFGLLLAVPVMPAVNFLDDLARRWIWNAGWLPHAEALKKLAESADALTYLGFIRHDPVALALLGIIVGVVGPVAEEIFFRGFAYRAFRERFGVWPGVFLSAFLFAAIHGNPVELVPIFIMGIVLALLYERTGSLAAPIGLHCANNTVTLVLFLITGH